MTPALIECRESGCAHQDRTGDYCRPASDWEYAEAMKRQAAAFDASDLAEECDEIVLALLKGGFPEKAGRLLSLRMRSTVARRVVSELA